MGRGSNGTRGSGRPSNSTGKGKGKEGYTAPQTTIKTDRSSLRATEEGLSERAARNILAYEDSVKDKTHETVQVFDMDGNLVAKNMRGGKHSVSVPTAAYRPNLILSHNHPNQTNNASRFAPIGQSLSGADVANMIRLNHYEVRARSAGYVYSIRRPKGGFSPSINPARLASEMDTTWRNGMWEINNRLGKLRREGKLTDQEYRVRKDRELIVLNHSMVRDMAKKYGLIYTRRKA